MGGYQGKILEIDLTERVLRHMPTETEPLREYIGGSGLAAKLFLELVSPAVAPLSLENPLLILSGPLTGTSLPGTGRFSVAAKSPLTNIWGEGNCGGSFGPELKFAGYDGVIIKGASDKPVYIFIEDDKVEISDATDLWGKDTYEATAILKQRAAGERKAKVLAIGQGGEKLVKFAAIANDGEDFVGRCGLGAVMGAKRLKAIVVRGTGKVQPAAKDEYEELVAKSRDKVAESQLARNWREHGTDIGMVAGTRTAGVVGRNWTRSDLYDFAKSLRGFAITNNYLVRRKACYACPIGCKRVVSIKSGPYTMEEGPGPEFQTCCNFGTTLMNNNLEAVIKCNELCNRYGLDTISCGSTIAFATECFENGLLGKGDTDGIELGWGDADAAIEMIHKIATRKGFGDILAEGVRIAANRIGGAALDYAIEVKGLELAMHDPRAFHGQGLGYVTSNCGTHTQHLNWLIEENFAQYPEIGLSGGYEGKTSTGKALLTYMSENIATLCNAGAQCLYVMGCLSFDDLVQMLRVTTGFDYDTEEALKCSDRLWLLKRGLCNLMGSGAADDRLPKRLMTPFDSGPSAGSVPDMDLMLREYYELRALDKAGRPQRDKLTELNLGDLAFMLP